MAVEVAATQSISMRWRATANSEPSAGEARRGSMSGVDSGLRRFSWPNETETYRAARDDLTRAEHRLSAAIEEVAQRRRDLTPGGALPAGFRVRRGPPDIDVCDDAGIESIMNVTSILRKLLRNPVAYDNNNEGTPPAGQPAAGRAVRPSQSCAASSSVASGSSVVTSSSSSFVSRLS